MTDFLIKVHESITFFILSVLILIIGAFFYFNAGNEMTRFETVVTLIFFADLIVFSLFHTGFGLFTHAMLSCSVVEQGERIFYIIRWVIGAFTTCFLLFGVLFLIGAVENIQQVYWWHFMICIGGYVLISFFIAFADDAFIWLMGKTDS